MATASGEPEAHPIASAVARIHTELDHLAEVGCWSLTGPELADSLTSLGALRSRVTELELRVARQADRLDLGTAAGRGHEQLLGQPDPADQTRRQTTP